MVFIALSAGCGGSSDDLPRVAVSGKVSLDGSPVPTGSVAFVPVGKGPACGAGVKDGIFSIDQEKGPVPGEYDVRLSTQTEKSFGEENPEPPPAPPKPLRVKVTADGKELDLKF